MAWLQAFKASIEGLPIGEELEEADTTTLVAHLIAPLTAALPRGRRGSVGRGQQAAAQQQQTPEQQQQQQQRGRSGSVGRGQQVVALQQAPEQQQQQQQRVRGGSVGRGQQPQQPQTQIQPQPQQLQPQTYQQPRVWDLIPPHWTQPPTHFVSHAWGAPWQPCLTQVVRKLAAWRRETPSSPPSSPPSSSSSSMTSPKGGGQEAVEPAPPRAQEAEPAAAADTPFPSPDITVKLSTVDSASSAAEAAAGGPASCAVKDSAYVWLDWVALSQHWVPGIGQPPAPDLERVKACVLGCPQGASISMVGAAFTSPP